jgi:hypothetical protein
MFQPATIKMPPHMHTFKTLLAAWHSSNINLYKNAQIASGDRWRCKDKDQ